jgi:hypothetical protein
MANEIQLTEHGKAVKKAVEGWLRDSAPKGLDLDQTPNGELNGQIIKSYLENKKLPFTSENLTAAVKAETNRFVWQAGFGPKAAPAAAPRKIGRFNQSVDSGHGAPKIDPTSTHAYALANKEDRTKEAAAARAAEETRVKAAADTRLEYEETKQIIYFDGSSNAGGRINHAATNAAREAAKIKWSKIRGVQPAASKLEKLPLHCTAQQLRDATVPVIQLWARERRANGLAPSVEL